MATNNTTWGVAEAKAHLSELIDQAIATGPQVITRSGKRAVVVVAADEWDRKTRRKGNLADFFSSSPLRGSGLNLSRRKYTFRKVDL
jgi:prevent-host-death family protein